VQQRRLAAPDGATSATDLPRAKSRGSPSFQDFQDRVALMVAPLDLMQKTTGVVSGSAIGWLIRSQRFDRIGGAPRPTTGKALLAAKAPRHTTTAVVSPTSRSAGSRDRKIKASGEKQLGVLVSQHMNCRIDLDC